MHFQIFMDPVGYYRWRLQTADNKVIAISPEGYTSKLSCLDSISIIKATNSSTPIKDC